MTHLERNEGGLDAGMHHATRIVFGVRAYSHTGMSVRARVSVRVSLSLSIGHEREFELVCVLV